MNGIRTDWTVFKLTLWRVGFEARLIARKWRRRLVYRPAALRTRGAN